MFFRYLRKSQHIFIDPAENLVIGTPQRRLQRIPSEAEVRCLLDAVDTSSPTGIRDKAGREILMISMNSEVLTILQKCGIVLSETCSPSDMSRLSGPGGVIFLGDRHAN